MSMPAALQQPVVQCVFVTIGEEKAAAVSRLFFFSFMTTFDNFCPSASVRPSVPTEIFRLKTLVFRAVSLNSIRGLADLQKEKDK